ncbi:hypothetical protein [Geodermatophilus marinus]|uniref:hypothetical protein n=1 Tax=Geodermatophilus sp. LHW52908 TaxID=2303986 RepID=UPI000E3DBD37|nr:hypothetical protein [Geodermatophilus sp. LHW52908]RFU20289.1 hypothetical protein D0Z06_16570 [Geodermatophilus sp. LHW52908]
MPASTRPRLLRATAAAFAIAAATFTTAACGEDVVDDGVEQEVEDVQDEVEQEVDDATDGEDEG